MFALILKLMVTSKQVWFFLQITEHYINLYKGDHFPQCQVLTISFHLFCQDFSRILALSPKLWHIFITTVRHRKAESQTQRQEKLWRARKRLGERMLKQWYHPQNTLWGMEHETLPGLLAQSLSYYYIGYMMTLVFRLIFANSFSDIIEVWLKNKNII